MLRGQKNIMRFHSGKKAELSASVVHLLAVGIILLLGILWAAKPAVADTQATFIVNTADDIDDGVCNAAHCSLREAITAANDETNHPGPDIINFAADYVITLDNAQLPVITSDITINGHGIERTIIQASTCDPINLPGGCTPAGTRVFELRGDASAGGAPAYLTLQYLTVRYGRNMVTSGGAIFAYPAVHLTLVDVDIANNYAYGGYGGGGIQFNDGTLKIYNSTIRNNYAGVQGGGISVLSGTTILNNSTISDNYTDGVRGSGYGGGIFTGTGAQYGLNKNNDLTLNDSVVVNNHAVGMGGGIWHDDANDPAGSLVSNIQLNNSRVISNTADGNDYYGNSLPFSGGGGIYNRADATLVNTTVQGNFVTNGDGGGIYNNSLSALSLTDSQVISNTAPGKGGGLYNDGALVDLAGGKVSGNVASSFGGGIYTNSGIFTLTAGTVAGNSSSANGGGIAGDGGAAVVLSRATVSDNSASFNGGGIWNAGVITATNTTIGLNSAGIGGGISNNGTAALTNATIGGNNALSGGGGIYNADSLKLINVIVGDSSTGSDCVNLGSIAAGSTNNLIESAGNACGLANGSNGNITGQDPALGPLADNGGPTLTMSPAPTSPAIDAGLSFGAAVTGADAIDAANAVTCLEPTDQRGVSAPQGGACDIGSVEVASESLAVVVGYFLAEETGENAGDAGVRITWQTVTESGVAGFNLWAEDEDGNRIQLNAELIPSPVIDSLEPANYSFMVQSVLPLFYLEEITVEGGSRQFGPFALGVAYGVYQEEGPLNDGYQIWLPSVRR